MKTRLRTGARRGVIAALVLALAGQAVAQTPGEMTVTVREGEGALNNIRTLRAKEPVVVVQDANQRPVAGATVTFLLPELGASGVFPSGTSLIVTTQDDGVAVGKGFKPNNVVGDVEIRVVASFQGQTARAIIHQTNAAPKASSGGGSKKTAVLLAVIGGAGAAVAVGVTRGGSKSATPTPPANPGTSISTGGSTFGPPR